MELLKKTTVFLTSDFTFTFSKPRRVWMFMLNPRQCFADVVEADQNVIDPYRNKTSKGTCEFMPIDKYW